MMIRRLTSAVISVALVLSAALIEINAFDLAEHFGITHQILSGIQATINGTAGNYFSKTAKEQIVDANLRTDSEFRKSNAFWSPDRHFINEELIQSSVRLVDLRKDILEDLRRVDRRNAAEWQERAWANLGKALHAIQDFYSHSNWVELGEPGIVNNFGISAPFANPEPSLHACPTDPNVLGPNGGGGLTTGYFIGLQWSWPPIGCSKWMLPEGKCFHGNYTTSCPGINKDKQGFGRPGMNDHEDAMNKARVATQKFVEDLIKQLEDGAEWDALKRLLGIGKSFVLVMQTDDQMGMPHPQGRVLEHVQATIAAAVQRIQGNPPAWPIEWGLVPFNDPLYEFITTWFPLSGDPPYVLDDASEYLAAVQGLATYGGYGSDGCAVPSLAALSAAVDVALPGSEVFCSQAAM